MALKWSRMAKNGLKMVKDGQKWPRMAYNGLERPRMSKNVQKCPKMAFDIKEWPEMNLLSFRILFLCLKCQEWLRISSFNGSNFTVIDKVCKLNIQNLLIVHIPT